MIALLPLSPSLSLLLSLRRQGLEGIGNAKFGRDVRGEASEERGGAMMMMMMVMMMAISFLESLRRSHSLPDEVMGMLLVVGFRRTMGWMIWRD